MDNNLGIILIALVYLAFFALIIGILRTEQNQFTSDKPDQPETTRMEQSKE